MLARVAAQKVNAEAARRIAGATSVLQEVLGAGSPGAMETAVAKAVAQGRVDEAVLNLLDANIMARRHHCFFIHFVHWIFAARAEGVGGNYRARAHMPPFLFSCAQAAERAGAAEPAAAMKKVRARADRELDKAKTPQERLMSQLLRSPTAELRKELLTKAFEAKESLLLAAGDEELKAPAPEV
jgi:hypothetical protein